MTISSYGLHRPLGMAPEFHNPKIPIVAGEIVEGVILDYENVVGIVSGQRVNEESVGPAPCEGWEPHKPGVVPGIGHIRYGR